MIDIKSYYGLDPKKQGFFWPESDQKRKEYFSVKRGSPSEAESVYQCNPGGREGSIFLEADFAWYSPPFGLEYGISSAAVREFLTTGQYVVQAWDTAFSAASTADYSVGITALLRSCDLYHRNEDPVLLGPVDPHFDVYVLDLHREQLDWAGLVPAAKSFYRKWMPYTAVVEKKASGLPVISTLQQAGMSVEGIDANIGKRARAISGVGAGSVQGWFRLHRVYFPMGAPWVPPLTKELKDFSGDDAGTDDQVDAIVHLITWAIRMGGTTAMLPSSWTPDTVDKNMGKVDVTGNPLPGLEALFTPGHDPLQYACARCQLFKQGRCGLTGHTVLPFDSCTEWSDGTTKLGVV